MLRPVKLLCVFLTAVMLLPMASCNTDKNKISYVNETDPWYSDTEIDIEQLTSDEFGFSQTGLKLINNDRMVIRRQIDIDGRRRTELTQYDMSGVQTGLIDMADVFDSSQQYFFEMNGKSYVMGFDYDLDYNQILKLFSLDFANGRYISEEVSQEFRRIMERDCGFINEQLCLGIGDHLYGIFYSNETGELCLAAIDPEWNVEAYPISDVLDRDAMEYRLKICNISGRPVIACFSERENVLIELSDTGAGLTTRPLDGALDLASDAYGSYICSTNDAIYTYKDYELCKTDMETFESTHIFDLNECNVNRQLFECGSVMPVYIDDDKIIFCPNEDMQGSLPFRIFILNKEETNPNAGKAVLDCALLGSASIDYYKAEVIKLFNDMSSRSLIRIDTRYITPEYRPDDDYDIEESQIYYRNKKSEIRQQLLIDIMDGNGPDMIIGGFDSTEINNDACFIDLAPYLTSLDQEELYMNVITASMTDNKLYQIPVTFLLSGLEMSSEIWNGNLGPTYTEYQEIVTESLDGYDPLTWNHSQMDFFITAVSASCSDFINGDSVCFDNEEFYALSSYCRDYFTEESGWSCASRNGDDINKTDSIYKDLDVRESSFGLPDGSSGYHGYSTIRTGLPSYQGRNLAFRCDENCISAGITKTCPAPDLCWEFISYSLTLESQLCDTTGSDNAIPVNRQALYDKARSYNSRQIELYEYSCNLLAGTGVKVYPEIREITDGEISDLDTSIAGIEDCSRIDSGIEIILREEIQPYFRGDKTLDEIIPIIEDRVQRVLSER